MKRGNASCRFPDTDEDLQDHGKEWRKMVEKRESARSGGTTLYSIFLALWIDTNGDVTELPG